MSFLETLSEKMNDSKNITKTACVIIFVVISFMLGSFYIRTVSPLTLPDANMHLENAISLAEGNIFLTQNYTQLPSQYSLDYKSSDGSRPLQEFAKTDLLISDIVPKAFSKADEEWISRITALEKPSGESNTYVRRQYPSINWLPQAIGFSIAHSNNASIANTFISMRVVNLIFYILMAVISIFLLPRGKIIGTALLLNPYTIFLASSISGDVFTIAVSSLFIAYLFNLSTPGEKLSQPQKYFLFFLGILLFLTKVAYIPLILLIFAIPKERLILIKKLIYAALIGVIGSLLYLIWSKFFSTVGYPIKFDPEKNLSYILKRPWDAIVSLFNNTLQPKEVLDYWNKIFSNSSKPLSQQLLYPVIICFFLGIVWILIYLIFLKNKANWKLFIFALLGAFFSVIITNTALLVTWTFVYKFGFRYITGFQGRYYLPLVLLLLVPWVAKYKKENRN